jgi:hypothetical protein
MKIIYDYTLTPIKHMEKNFDEKFILIQKNLELRLKHLIV